MNSKLTCDRLAANIAMVFLMATGLCSGQEVEAESSSPDWLQWIARVIEHTNEESTDVDDGPYGDAQVKFRLFKPLGIEAHETFPLIVWLHGFGESGDDNTLHLRWLDLIFTDLEHPDQYRFYLCALQCPSTHPTWFGATESRQASKDPIAVNREIIDHLLETYSIDKTRIYLAGVSSGGAGCWEMAMRYPDFFAAVTPLASPGADRERIKLLRDVPVWAFHSQFDPGTDVILVRGTITELKQIGGKCALTETPGRLHDCWTAAFEEYDLVHWLLAQQRGNVGCPAPGTLSFTARKNLARRRAVELLAWWPQGLVLSVVGLLGIGVYRNFRKPRDSNIMGQTCFSRCNPSEVQQEP